jgi:hypothetical protein
LTGAGLGAGGATVAAGWIQMSKTKTIKKNQIPNQTQKSKIKHAISKQKPNNTLGAGCVCCCCCCWGGCALARGGGASKSFSKSSNSLDTATGCQNKHVRDCITQRETQIGKKTTENNRKQQQTTKDKRQTTHQKHNVKQQGQI